MSGAEPAAEGSWEAVDHARLAAQLGAARAAPAAAELSRLAELVGIVYRLRDDDGCAWDRAQSLSSMAANLVEEAYETCEAIAAGDDAHTAEELGDTLMNVLLMARIAAQAGRFDLGQVAAGIATKLVRRHPHVFGSRRAADAGEALASWSESKARERGAPSAGSLLDAVPAGMPALAAARKLGEKAAGVGFDWPDAHGALAKLREEVGELEQACAATTRPAVAAQVADELGDVLFAAVNVARKLRLDPELLLRATSQKFRRRFRAVEQHFGARLAHTPLEDLERVWRAAAAAEARGEG